MADKNIHLAKRKGKKLVKNKPIQQKSDRAQQLQETSVSKPKRKKERMKRKTIKANVKVNTEKSESNKKVVDKLKAFIKLEKKGNFKKPLTDRQKHKLLKLKMKRKAKKAGKVTKGNILKTSGDTSLDVTIPNRPEEASSNWKKLQQTALIKKPLPNMKKRKLSPDRIRNPKHRKLIEGETRPQPEAANKKQDIWFDDVDEFLLEGTSESNTVTTAQVTQEKPNSLVKPEAFKGLTKAVAMDCEMVGVGDGSDNMVARVSIVNQHGEQIYDKFVKPKERVVDYRTHVSGVRHGDIEKGETLEKVQADVAEILKGRILVGHAIQNDLKVLFLEHPRRKIRDTSRYKPFRRLFQGRTPSLKNLSSTVLKVKVQEGEHNSVQDAQAAMRLYTMFRQQWESELKVKRIRGRGGGKAKTKAASDRKPR